MYDKVLLPKPNGIFLIQGNVSIKYMYTYTLYSNFHSDKKQIEGEACLMRCQHDVKCNILLSCFWGDYKNPRGILDVCPLWR